MNDTINKIQTLMKEERFDDARRELSAFVQSDEFLRAQAAPAYITLMMTYLGVLTEARLQYNMALDTGIALLKAVNKREQEMKDGIDLARVQHEVDKLKR